MDRDTRFHLGLLVCFSVLFLWSAIKPKDYYTWILEVLPAVIGIGILLAAYHHFRLSNLTYGLIWVHAIILIIGGHYTYAEMPLFEWLQQVFGLARNYYDRLGHLVQGFVPAIITREILIRTSPLKKSRWLPVLVIAVVLSISALYELLEWGVAVASGTAAEAFLGTQGDVWDTQWDMFLALLGGIAALVLMRKSHDRSIAKLRATH